MNIMTSSKELVDLIKNVDTAFHTKQSGSGKSVLNSLYGHIPLICEQLQDWEDGLCESDVDGSFLHENWNKDLRLFSDGEDGGQHLLQLFILRAEAELQGNSGDNLVENLRLICSLKERMNCLFGGYTVNQISIKSEATRFEQSRDEIFRPRRVGNKALVDVKYKGDWMKRPISDNEVGWLANLLVWLSTWLNESLGLSQPEAESSNTGPRCSYVGAPIDVEREPAETAKMVLYAIGSWFSMLGATIVELMRKHGLRINLRMLASKKVMMVLFVYALFGILKKAFRLFYRV